jgi:hypothetical protein
VDIGQEDFLDALRKNGSLHKVSIADMKCSTEVQGVQLYCVWNRLGVLQEHYMDFCIATLFVSITVACYEARIASSTTCHIQWFVGLPQNHWTPHP